MQQIRTPRRPTLLLALLFAFGPAWSQAPQPAPAAKPAAAAKAKAPREGITIDPASIMQPWKGDLDGMIERRIVRVLVVPGKTLYFQDKGTQRGTSYDAFRLVEQELNGQLEREQKLKSKHLKVKFFFVPVRRDKLLEALVEGKGDIAAANLTITPERQKAVDFSVPIMTGVREVLVTGPASPNVAGVDDLAGKEVFVRKSSSYFQSIAALNARFKAAGKPPVAAKEAPEQFEDEDLIEMLNAGLVSTLVVDKHKADLWAKVFPKIKVRDDIVLREGGDIAWAIRKDSPQLKAFLDKVATAATSGNLAKQRDQILARYLKSLRYVKDAASDAERRKFLALIDFFRKYGERYDVDWLLMAAQGYQESALNQDARSPVGAVGVMQVMPATGKDMNVGDIGQTENNVHAGVKYMRFVIDQFYEKEPMSKLDKALFAFASYNAGPGRVAQLRKEAERRGLDPNVWFGNVEYVAAEKIGQETVTYVGNIYKYYVAYRLIMETQQERESLRKELKGGAKK